MQRATFTVVEHHTALTFASKIGLILKNLKRAVSVLARIDRKLPEKWHAGRATR